jgi:hypothetical protein
MQLITESTRYSTLKVLEPGEVFVTSAPPMLGLRSVRRELQATEINRYPIGEPRRGFYFMGIESQYVLPSAVSYGVRA